VILGRDAAAVQEYRAATHAERRTIADMAVCDQENCMGLKRDYQAKSWNKLRAIRRMSNATKAHRFMRRAGYYQEMVKVIVRTEQMKESPLP